MFDAGVAVMLCCCLGSKDRVVPMFLILSFA
jgi:hypothetical protein